VAPTCRRLREREAARAADGAGSAVLGCVGRGAWRGETRPERRRGGSGLLPYWAAREAGPEEGRG
jgi:hypothetical protein